LGPSLTLPANLSFEIAQSAVVSHAAANLTTVGLLSRERSLNGMRGECTWVVQQCLATSLPAGANDVMGLYSVQHVSPASTFVPAGNVRVEGPKSPRRNSKACEFCQSCNIGSTHRFFPFIAAYKQGTASQNVQEVVHMFFIVLSQNVYRNNKVQLHWVQDFHTLPWLSRSLGHQVQRPSGLQAMMSRFELLMYRQTCEKLRRCRSVVDFYMGLVKRRTKNARKAFQ
jgi:hypothetical protein